MGVILGNVTIRERVATFTRRHRIALVGLLLGALLLEITRSIQGSGDFTFQPTSTAQGESLNSLITLKGERSAELILPKSYVATKAVPLLIDLHGYTGSGPTQSAYSKMQEAAFASGVAYIAPTGSEDNLGNNFWNASDACCDFNKSKVDDVAYIDSLIEKSIAAANIDSKRIYLFGHSNGHFMAYAYLCSGSTKVAAIAGLAGAMDPNPSRCKASSGNVLHIHGEKDGTILFAGGSLFGSPYTSADETVGQWQTINKCSPAKESSFNLLESIPSEDALANTYDCARGSLEFWRLPLGVHTPALDLGFADRVILWLQQHKSL
jgi:polyhydroxybutyrate depolymerase